jgi:hypothetical protein
MAMILDKGVCSIFRKTDSSGAGMMPAPSYSLMHQSWYGELSFETAPMYRTPKREDVKTDARIRVLQNRAIANHDVVVLKQCSTVIDGDVVYEVNRAYHGNDDENGTSITDLSLEVIEL